MNHSYDDSGINQCSKRKSEYKQKLIQRLRNTIHERNDIDLFLEMKFKKADAVVSASPFPLVGIGALKCVREYDTGAINNFLDILIAAENKQDPGIAIIAMAKECVELFDDDINEAFQRIVNLSTECGILSAIVGLYAGKLLNQASTDSLSDPFY